MKSTQPRHPASLRREYNTTTKEYRSSAIRSMEPLTFFADSTDLDVTSIDVFADHDDDAVALSFVTGCGTVNVRLESDVALALLEGLHDQLWELESPQSRKHRRQSLRDVLLGDDGPEAA